MEKTANEKPTDNGPTDEQPKEQALSLISIIMAAGLGKRMICSSSTIIDFLKSRKCNYGFYIERPNRIRTRINEHR